MSSHEKPKKHPLVTICVPTIGRMEYLPETRRSITAQTFGDFEVLVLDNESPAPAQEMLAEWSAADDRVRILRAEPRIPMFRNFNRGVTLASGKYVTFFHDDDVYAPDFLRDLVAMLEAHPRAGIAGSNYDFIDELGRVSERRRWIRKTEIWEGRQYIRALFRRGRNPVPMPGMLYRRDVLGEGFDENISPYFGDFAILMRIAESHDVAVVAKPLIGVRRHGQQASLGMPWSETVGLRTDCLREYCAGYAQRWPDERAFAASLERSLVRSQRTWFVWGWLSASTNDEAMACLTRLSASPEDAQLGSILQSVDRLGVRSFLRNKKLLDLLRKLGTAVGG